MICLTCGGAVKYSSLLTGKLVHDNLDDWASKGAGGAHPVRVEHAPTPDSPVVQRHPGGKDGLYRAYCVCGYITGFDTITHVNRDLTQHITAKASV